LKSANEWTVNKLPTIQSVTENHTCIYTWFLRSGEVRKSQGI